MDGGGEALVVGAANQADQLMNKNNTGLMHALIVSQSKIHMQLIM
jgi:hypothetical protein